MIFAVFDLAVERGSGVDFVNGYLAVDDLVVTVFCRNENGSNGKNYCEREEHSNELFHDYVSFLNFIFCSV